MRNTTIFLITLILILIVLFSEEPMNLLKFLKEAEKNSVLSIVDEDSALDLMRDQYGDTVQGYIQIVDLLNDLNDVGYVTEFDNETFDEVYADDADDMEIEAED